MLVLIFGKDDYRAKEKAKQIIADYQKNFPTKIKLEDFEEIQKSFISLKESLKNISLFDSQRIVLLRDVFANKNFKQDFLEQAEEILTSKSLVIFLEQRPILKNDNLLKFFEKNGNVFQFNPLSIQKIKEYIKNRLKEQDIKINETVLSKLTFYLGNDLWRVSSELSKIISFCASKKIVESKDIELLIKPTIESAIFQTLEAIASQNKGLAIFLIHQHIANGDSPFYLLSMINYQFRNLLLIKEQEGKDYYQIVRELKPLSPFVIKKNLSLVKKFSKERLEKIYFKIFKIDIAIKMGKINPGLGLDLLIADI